MFINFLIMKNLLFTVFLVAATLAANAQTGMFSKYKATYYVSDSGNDSNSGRYPWAPWKTLDKVNTATLIPGTTVALKCGDEFTGTIYVDDWQAKLGATANNRITVTSYGYGNKPKIYGSVPVAGWTQRGSSAIYTKQITSDVGQLFYYGRRMTEARHPNAGESYCRFFG
jgi:hypothetical protein